MALADLGERERGAGTRVAGLDLGGAGEQVLRTLQVAGLQVGLAGQRERLRRGLCGVDLGTQRLQGLLGQAGTQVRLGEQLAGQRQPGRQLDGLGEVGLGLRQRAQVELGRAGQLQQQRVVRGRLQQRRDDLARGGVVLAQEGHLRVEQLRDRLLGQRLLQFGHMGVGAPSRSFAATSSATMPWCAGIRSLRSATALR